MSVRILDLGCHDGFVGSWLAGQLGDQVELHGMELHPDAAEHARARGYVRVVEDRAERASTYWAHQSFDLVVAYELIEHVPHPVELLRSCERMLAPGGRILISTPDGCFGEGHNPHHLRALRSLDLADLLRRRGHLLDMGVGPDGISVAAYEPRARRGEVAIYCGPGWERWHPMDIATRGLGGSETAAYRLAEALSELDYVVTLYGQCDEGMMRDVMVRDWRTFDPTEERLAVISSRIPELFDRPLNAQQKLLWLHDTSLGERLSAERAAKIDRVLCLSHWHERHLAGCYPFLDGKLHRIRNGITPSYFTREPAPEREQRVLYTSSPDRGLDVLLELWPAVRAAVPDAELIHAYAPVYDRIASQDKALGEFREKVGKLADQPGVKSLSGMPQGELANLMRSSLVWCHPSYNTLHGVKFHETSCIGAMEAQAAGCHVVAANWGALPETVQVGTLIDQGPDTGLWRRVFADRFVEAIIEGLADERVQLAAQSEGPEIALGWDWAGVGEMVAAVIEPAPALAAA